jgi:membrane fusion protein (multidrug efflux system)
MELNTSKTPSKQRLFIGVGIVVIAAAGIYGYFKYQEFYPSTDDAYVNANLVNVATKVGGYINNIAVNNNQYVHKGDLLLSLNDKDYQVAVEQAKQNYNSQVEMTKIAKEQIEVQKKQLIKDEQQVNFLKQRAERYTTLYKANTVSQQDYQKAVTDYKDIIAQLAMDNQKYQQFVSTYQYSITKANLAKAQLDGANLNLSYSKYYAPIDGYVTELSNLTSGELVSPGKQLFAIIDTQNWWIDAHFKETQISRIKPGQKVAVSLDMYNHTYYGQVQSITNASGNTFSVLPAQNATGNWVKVTQRFTIRVKLNNDKDYPLRVGASSKVVVDTL